MRRIGPKPYYERGGITLYHGDCLAVLPTLQAGSVDLVLTDPPYNVGLAYGDSVDDERSDYEVWCSSWFQELRRASPLVLLTPGIANLGMWHRIEQPRWVMAWTKKFTTRRCYLGFNRWEPILLWGSTKARTHGDWIEATIKPDPTARGHPCPKPLAWADQLIERFSPSSGLVLDPFAGSGTVLVSAGRLGRHAIGVEIEERYCDIIADRLDALFDGFGTSVSTQDVAA